MAAFHLSLSEFKQSEFAEEEQYKPSLDPSDEDYAKSLMYSLRSNLQDLKNEANGLKNATFRDTGNSTLQTFRSPGKVLDYRKTPVSQKASCEVSTKAKVEKKGNSQQKLEFPSYGRGIDPPVDADFGYMKKINTNTNFAPLKKVILERNFEKYLTEKQLKSQAGGEGEKPFYWEEPKIVQFLREEYLRMTRRTENRLLKTVLVTELTGNPQLGVLFGVTELINPALVNEIVQNVGVGDSITLDEFLQFYQVSKNNLLRSKQIFFEAEEAKKASMPNLKLKLEYLLEKFAFECPTEPSKDDFIKELNGSLQAHILEILQITPILYESLEDFISALESSDESLSLELLLSLFAQEELCDYILPEDLLAVFESVFSSLPQEASSGGVSSGELIEALFANEAVQNSLNTVARSPQGLPSIQAETLQELLDRILAESPEWLTWEEFLRYFSIEGRPDEEKPVIATENKPPLGFRYKITVPSPFNFMRRDSIKPPSIRERKLKEMLEAKKKLIDDEIKDKFKAQPVPPEVKIPLFEFIMKEQEQRRLKLKDHFEAITKSLERPFSFYYRDLAKPEIKAEEMKVQVFTANPVPWFCKIERSALLLKAEEIRKDRIVKQAKESLSHAKMPPRMEQAMKTAKKPVIEEEKVPQFKAKDAPDFKSLQTQFVQSLLEKKSAFTPTVPKPFAFHENQKSQEALKLLDCQAQALSHWAGKVKTTCRALSAFSKPKMTAGITQKAKDMMAAKKEYLKKCNEEKELKLEEAEIRRIKHEMMRKQMVKANVIKKSNRNRNNEEKLRQNKEEMRRREMEYRMKLQEINEKISQSGFLIERAVSNSLSRGFESMEPVRKMINQEYISEAVTSQEQEGSEEGSFAE